MVDSHLYDVLSQIDFGIVVLFMIAIASMGFTLVKIILKVKSWFKSRISDEREDSVNDYIKTEAHEELRSKVYSMESEIKTIKSTITDLSKDIKEQQKQSGDKIDKLCQTVSAQKEKSDENDIELRNRLSDLNTVMSSLRRDVSDLIGSDQLQIKNFITETYHRCVPTGEIDTLTMSIVEERYTRYDSRKGNTFVKSCVEELRKLKKINMTATNNADLIHYITLYGGEVNSSEDIINN